MGERRGSSCETTRERKGKRGSKKKSLEKRGQKGSRETERADPGGFNDFSLLVLPTPWKESGKSSCSSGPASERESKQSGRRMKREKRMVAYPSKGGRGSGGRPGGRGGGVCVVMGGPCHGPFLHYHTQSKVPRYACTRPTGQPGGMRASTYRGKKPTCKYVRTLASRTEQFIQIQGGWARRGGSLDGD